MNIYHYTHEERWTNFRDVIMCLLTMHATLNGNMIAESNEEDYDTRETLIERAMLPSDEEYQQMLIDHATFKTTDPSNEYDITSRHKLGIGGFAKVFKVVRH